MTAHEHLQVFDLTLTTMAPLFVGDGGVILKKSYLYDSRSGKVSIFDEEKFFALLARKNLADPCERFMLGRMDNLYAFLTKDCRLSEADWAPALRYTLDAGAALDAQGRNEMVFPLPHGAASHVPAVYHRQSRLSIPHGPLREKRRKNIILNRP